ncbi:ectonucleoside triphosphate diphosphohydrolase 5-like isoform X2 [Antedon mediterranea]
MYRNNGKGKGKPVQTSATNSPLLIEIVEDTSKDHRKKIIQMSEKTRFLAFLLLSIIVICGIFSMLKSKDVVQEQHNLDNIILFDPDSSSSEADLNDSNESTDFYTVIFDGGSTGSRVHIFHFRKNSHGLLPYLVKETYNFTRLGLSAYAQNPVKGAVSLQGLLSQALSTIPEQLWGKTPVALKATAGLRLLPQQEAGNLLSEVYRLFLNSPLFVEPFDQSVTILDGAYEGIYLWQAINFLKGTLYSQSDGTSGVIDLGGGSVQITYSPQELKSVIDKVDDRDIREINIFGKSYFLLVHSYLGNGLLVALQGILQIEGAIHSKSANKDKNQGFYKSICLPHAFSGKLKFGDKDTIVMGPPSSSENTLYEQYEQCTYYANKFLDSKSIQPLPEATRSSSFVGAGYFISRGTKHKLVDESIGKISITVGEIREHAKQACNNMSFSNPFECIELAYISSLLSYGFRLNDNAQILIQDKINNVETSWALGAAFHILQNHWK